MSCTFSFNEKGVEVKHLLIRKIIGFCNKMKQKCLDIIEKISK
jgi:hypothetical protein